MPPAGGDQKKAALEVGPLQKPAKDILNVKKSVPQAAPLETPPKDILNVKKPVPQAAPLETPSKDLLNVKKPVPQAAPLETPSKDILKKSEAEALKKPSNDILKKSEAEALKKPSNDIIKKSEAEALKKPSNDIPVPKRSEPDAATTEKPASKAHKSGPASGTEKPASKDEPDTDPLADMPSLKESGPTAGPAADKPDLKDILTGTDLDLEEAVKLVSMDMRNIYVELKDYRNCMQAHACYECLVTFDAIALHAYAHRTLAPNLGAVQLLQQQHWPVDMTNEHWRGWQEIIVVRSTSRTDPPEHGHYQVVNGDALRLAFVHGWAQAKEAEKPTDAFQTAARCVKVRFELLILDETFEMKKWELNEKTNLAAETQILQGLKRALAVQGVADMLQREGQPNGPKDLEKWFKTAKVTTADMSARVVSTMMKVATRFKSAVECRLILTELDSAFGSKHAFQHSNSLDVACQKTGVKNNAKLAASLLLWCLSLCRDEMMRGDMPPEIGHIGVKAAFTRYLLKKRLVAYLVRKFTWKKVDAIEEKLALPVGYQCFEVLNTLFSNYEAWRQSGLSPGSEVSMAWLHNMPPHMVRVIHFCSHLLRGGGDLESVLANIVETSPLVSPEAALLQMQKFLDVDATIKEHDAWMEKMLAPAPPPEPALPTPTPEKDPVQVHTNAAESQGDNAGLIEDEQAHPADDDEEMQPADPVVDQVEATRTSYFPSLALSSAIVDMLKKNPDDMQFQHMVEEAIIRCSPAALLP
ncbi:unnamed protein product [Symbiodinium sp. CCMP2592]|nr:unnamed protein product [Symbiodinium sp. CCMP2592]